MGVIGTEVVEFRAAGLDELEAREEAFHQKIRRHAEERKAILGGSTFTSKRLFGDKNADRDAQRLAAALKDTYNAAHWANVNLGKLNALTFNKQYTADVRDLAAALRETTNAGAMLAGRLTSRRGGLAMPAVASVASVATPAPGTTPALPAPTLTSPPAPPRPASVSHPDVFKMLPIDTGTYGVKGVDAPGEKAARVRAGLEKQKTEEEAMAVKAEKDKKFAESWDKVPPRLLQAGKDLQKGAGKLMNLGGMTAAVAGAGLLHRGFSGTTDGERFSRELDMLARELAGAFKPLLNAATGGVRGAREFMERQGPQEQNQLAAAGMVLGVGAMANFKGGWAARNLGSIPQAAVALKLLDQGAVAVEMIGNMRNTDRLVKGDLTKEEFEGLPKEVRDIAKIEDPLVRAKKAEEMKAGLDKTMKKKLEFPGFAKFGGMMLNELDSIPGGRLGMLGDGGENLRDRMRDVGAANNIVGGLNRIIEDGKGGRKLGDLKPAADPNRNMVMLAQAGLNNAGGAFEDIYSELAKAGAGDKSNETPEAKLLRVVIDELRELNKKPALIRDPAADGGREPMIALGAN